MACQLLNIMMNIMVEDKSQQPPKISYLPQEYQWAVHNTELDLNSKAIDNKNSLNILCNLY